MDSLRKKNSALHECFVWYAYHMPTYELYDFRWFLLDPLAFIFQFNTYTFFSEARLSKCHMNSLATNITTPITNTFSFVFCSICFFHIQCLIWFLYVNFTIWRGNHVETKQPLRKCQRGVNMLKLILTREGKQILCVF